MSSLPIHPMIVHLPMALAVLVPLLGLGILIAWRSGSLPSRAWVLVAVLQAVLVASAVTAMNTGEREEERVERVVSERLIEGHETAAKLFTFAAVGVLLLGAGALAPRKETVRQGLAAASVAGSLAVLGLGINVGHAGGELVYRHGAASAYSGAAGGGAVPGTVPRERGERDDDDD